MRLMEYEILYAEYSENTAYICRKPFECEMYRIIEVTDRTRIAKYIKYFVTYKPKGFCKDFCVNGKYFAVFDAPDGIPLKVSGEILTARKVVKALAMQNLQLEIAVNVLSRDHIFVCGDELEFASDLPEIDVKITREYFFAKLADFVTLFLETDTNRNSEKWLADLRSGRFEDLLAAYRCMPDTAKEADHPSRECFKKIKAVLPRIAAVIAAITAIITTVIAVNQSGGDSEYDWIESLGTIDLTKE